MGPEILGLLARLSAFVDVFDLADIADRAAVYGRLQFLDGRTGTDGCLFIGGPGFRCRSRFVIDSASRFARFAVLVNLTASFGGCDRRGRDLAVAAGA